MFSKRGILGRIQEKTHITGDGCWEMRGKSLSCGYPRLAFNGDWYLAHRFVWEICHGEIPTALLVLHKCHNKLCVNPFHLNLGTHQDNSADITVKQLEEKEKSMIANTQFRPTGILENNEKETIQKILEENKYCKAKTSRALGISSTTLWRRIKKYNLV